MASPAEQFPSARPAAPERRNPETFGIEPTWWEREIPDAIKRLAPILRRYEVDSSGEDDLRANFTPVHGAAKVERDLAEVRRLEDAFEREDSHESRVASVYARTLELVIHDMANDWFTDAAATQSSKFDDYKRQTDMFLEVPLAGEGDARPLAVDVTAAMESARSKLKRLRESYEHGKFADVDYFTPVISSVPAGRVEMPRVIVGASRFGIAQLARLYAMVRIPDARPAGMTREEAVDRLRWHELGGQLYEEIIRQVDDAYETFRRLLKAAPAFQETRRGVYKERARYLDEVRRALRKGHAAWAKGREAFVRAHPDIAKEIAAPPNNVLEAVLE